MSTKLVMDSLQKKIAFSSLPVTQAKAWIARTEHFLTHKGKEWTSARGAALWNVANLHRSGAHEQALKVMQSSRIAHNDQGYPSNGVEAAIVRAYVESRRPSSTRRLAAVLRGYSSIRLSEASKSQVAKARLSINNPPDVVYPDITPIPNPSYMVVVDRKNVVTHLPGPKYGSWKQLDPSDLTYPSIAELSGTSRYPSTFHLPSRMKEKPFASLLASLMSKGKVPWSLLQCYREVEIDLFGQYGELIEVPDHPLRGAAATSQLKSGDTTLGRIVVLQEAGAKGRVITSPNAWIQFYLYPLHQLLARYIRGAEEGRISNGISSMYDQMRGVNHAMAVMESGGYVSAVDLSSATDRFPLVLQQATLRELNLGMFADAFDDLRGPYQGPDGDWWYYNTGQAMGLYGSFPLFHLTHWALLEGLVYRLRLDQDPSPKYAVLGDDVLFFSQELQEAYLAELDSWGVPVSWHKCYEGDLTEFAGFMISRKGEHVSGYRPFKHVEGGFAPTLNVCHAVGSRVRRWGPYWSRSFDAYQATLSKRDLSLEPLVSTSENSYGKAAYPGEAYLSSLVSEIRWTVPGIDPAIFEAWANSNLSLLKAKERLSDVGRPGIKTGDGFDPGAYVADERDRKSRDRVYRRMFSSDPLVRAYREQLDVASESVG